MRYTFMVVVSLAALAIGINILGAGPDAKQLAAKGHSLFLEALAGDRTKLPEAIATMEQSREADPQYVFNLYNLGRAYFFSSGGKNLEDFSKAEKVFAKIIELDPAHSRALSFHGAMLTALSGGKDLAKFFQGVQEMRKAIEMTPNDINNHIVMPFVSLNFPPEALKAMGNYDPVQDLQFVSNVFNGNKFHYAPHADTVMKAIIGDVYAERGETEKARAQFESALKVAQPEEPGAINGRKVLNGLITERMNGGKVSLRASVVGTCHACHLTAPEKLVK
jgi:hypothetical protein